MSCSPFRVRLQGWQRHRQQRRDSFLSPEEIYVGYQIRYFGDAELVEWGRNYPEIEAFLHHLAVDDLKTTNSKLARDVERMSAIILKALKNKLPQTDSSKKRQGAFVKSFFIKYLMEYIDGKHLTEDLCRMVDTIEHDFDFPYWIGDFWGYCDDFQCGFTPQNDVDKDRQYLAKEARRMLLEIK